MQDRQQRPAPLARHRAQDRQAEEGRGRDEALRGGDRQQDQARDALLHEEGAPGPRGQSGGHVQGAGESTTIP